MVEGKESRCLQSLLGSTLGTSTHNWRCSVRHPVRTHARQHLRMKDKWPDWEPARGKPYEDVENLRPESKKMVETWLKIYGDAKDLVLGLVAGN